MPRLGEYGCLSASREQTDPLPFCSTHLPLPPQGLYNAHPHGRGWSSVGNRIQMLISSRDILTGTPPNNVYQLSRPPLD